eukprot:jgi/Astpho2/1141/Aster-x0047
MKTFMGQVVSTKMQKSVLVAVSRWKFFHKYKLRRRWTKKYMAHDEENACNVGDVVRIDISRPLSKNKTWVVSDIVRREKVYDAKAAAAAVQFRLSEHSQTGIASANPPINRGFATSAI